ncbi:unnamed protein product [Caenorhabditis nigoni]
MTTPTFSTSSKPLNADMPCSMSVCRNYSLSKPICEICSYMPYPKDFNKFHVNGVDMDSDDYGYAVLNVCL